MLFILEYSRTVAYVKGSWKYFNSLLIYTTLNSMSTLLIVGDE